MLPHFMHRLRFKLIVVSLTLGLTFAFSAPRGVEKIGDNLQIALPMLGWGCSIINGQGLDYFIRFVTLEIFIHGSKQGLGEAEINRRPNGGLEGFPSGHTSAASFGASNLVYQCVTKNHWVQGAVLISAAFVGGSRVEANKHDMWQVLAGFFLGWLVDRLFRRRPGPLKRLVRYIAAKPQVQEARDQIKSHVKSQWDRLKSGGNAP